jgi:hypothetical protein
MDWRDYMNAYTEWLVNECSAKAKDKITFYQESNLTPKYGDIQDSDKILYCNIMPVNGSVSIGNVRRKAGCLPYCNKHCVAIFLDKSTDIGTPVIITEFLSGCSIHICDRGNHWVVMHDAREILDKDYYNDYGTFRGAELVDMNRLDKENERDQDKKIVSFEFSKCYGYRFLNGQEIIDGIQEKLDGDPVINFGATMFYFENEKWNISALAMVPDKNTQDKKIVKIFEHSFDDLMKKAATKGSRSSLTYRSKTS